MVLEEGPVMARAMAGDRQAFSELVAAHRGAVYRFALRLTQDPALSEDVLQETFIAALGGIGAWRGEGSFRGWLLSIARSRVLMARRRRAGEPATFEAETSLEQLGLDAGWGTAWSPEALAERTEARGQLERALEGLAEEEREVLMLRDLEGLSGEETAEVLGVGLAAMKSRLHRARLRLVAALKGASDGRE